MNELAKLAGKDIIELLAFITSGQEGVIGCYRVEKGPSGIHIWKGDRHVTISLDWGKDWRTGVRNIAVLDIDGETHYFVNTHHFTDEEWKKMESNHFSPSEFPTNKIINNTLDMLSATPGYAIMPDIDFSFVKMMFPDITEEVIEAMVEQDSKTIDEKFTVTCDGSNLSIITLVGLKANYWFLYYYDASTSSYKKSEMAWYNNAPRTVYFPDRVEHWELYNGTPDSYPAAVVWSRYRTNIISRTFHKKTDGPSIVWNSGREEWWSGGKLHRIDGPAITDGEEVCYYIHGVDVNNDILEMFNCLPRTCTDEQKVAMVLKWG